MKQSIFLVVHRHVVAGQSNDKVIGVFSKRSKAEEAVAQTSRAKGFRDARGGFEVVPLSLGTVRPSSGGEVTIND